MQEKDLELLNLVKEIISRDGFHEESPIDSFNRMYETFRNTRLHLLSLVEEKNRLYREVQTLQIALESALMELRISQGGKSISQAYTRFINREKHGRAHRGK